MCEFQQGEERKEKKNLNEKSTHAYHSSTRNAAVGISGVAADISVGRCLC